jgi:hypothetical protein
MPKAFSLALTEMAPPHPAIATLATGPALEDLQVLMATLELFNVNPPTVYLYCDSIIAKEIAGIKYRGTLHVKDALSMYSAYDRRAMESMSGKHFKTLWMDFMTEKINLLRWAMGDSAGPVLLCDADICFMGPLPAIPVDAKVCLSPHGIVERDEKRFGKYNGGYACFSEMEYVDVWWNACANARYYEQSALEDVAQYALEKGGPDALYEFPQTHNYGWWRVWQGVKSATELLKEWGINRNKASEASGICINGVPLSSVHTHFFERVDAPTKQFNAMILAWLKMLSNAHPPARKLLNILGARN